MKMSKTEFMEVLSDLGLNYEKEVTYTNSTESEIRELVKDFENVYELYDWLLEPYENATGDDGWEYEDDEDEEDYLNDHEFNRDLYIDISVGIGEPLTDDISYDDMFNSIY